MRVLFTCVVGSGHFNPTVPLSRAFVAAGHDVAYATDPDFSGRVRAVGFEAFPAGLDMADARRQFLRTMPDWRSVPPVDQIRHLVPGLFAGVRVEPMLRDLEPIIEGWRPDLLVHDSAEMAGAIAAERAGIAHVEHSFGILRPRWLRDLAVAALEPVCQRLGVHNPGIGGLGGELYLDICPPGIQRPEIADVPHVQPLRPIGFDEAHDANLPGWLDAPPDRPLVYVTMGTEFGRTPEIFRSILSGLVDDPWETVVTVGGRIDPEALGAWPANVHIERFLPQSRLLARSAVFVAHGGSGALLGALNAGVPMLALPQGADQFVNAERVVDTGIGLRLLPTEMHPDAVRSAVRRLIDDPSYRVAIGSHGPAIEAMPMPAAVVPVLAALV